MSIDSNTSDGGSNRHRPQTSRNSDFTRKFYEEEEEIHDSGEQLGSAQANANKISPSTSGEKEAGKAHSTKQNKRRVSMAVSASATSVSSKSSKSNRHGVSATNVSPYIRSIMKRRFKSADKKREEELLNELSEAKKLEYLAATTHFSQEEVEALAIMFHALTKDSKTPNMMDRVLFSEFFRLLFGITDSLMLDQIFYFFDADREGTISETEWIKNMGIILRGSLDEHCDYCFSVYDLNGDKSLGRTETRALVQHCMGKQLHGDDVDVLREVAELVYRKLDPTGSGRITPQTFRKAVHRDPLLLQSLGHCLPSGEKTETFLSMVVENSKNYDASYSLPQFPSYSYETARYENLSVHQLAPIRPRIRRKQSVRINSDRGL